MIIIVITPQSLNTKTLHRSYLTKVLSLKQQKSEQGIFCMAKFAKQINQRTIYTTIKIFLMTNRLF